MGFPCTFGSARYGGFPFSYSMKGIIYIATNLFNGRSYVGQTRTSLYHRREQHIRDAVTDSINHFHLALTQYGKDAFEWKVLDEFSGTKEEVIHALNVAEEYHILKHRTMLDEYGYNATKGGYSSDKFADVIKKRALANYGGRAVLQYDLDGHFLREYDSIAEVKRVMNAMSRKSTDFVGRMWRGYQWREKINEYFPRKISPYVIPSSPGVGVVVYTIDGKFYKAYSKQAECWKDLGEKCKVRDGFDGVRVKSCSKGKYLVFRDNGDYPQEIKVEIVYPIQKTSSNYDNRVSVSQYSLEGDFIRSFDSIVEANKVTGVNKKGILAGCKKPLPYVVGYKTKFLWRYGKSQQKIDVIIKEKKEVMQRTLEHRILQYDASGNFVKEWENMYQAAIQTGESHNLIRKQCLGLPTKKKTPSVWKYYKESQLAV